MRTPLLASALLLAGLATASAQTDGARSDGAKPDGGAAATPVPGQPATMADSLRPTFVAQAPDDMVASKLIGSSVVNGANETIGQIADFVLDQKGAVKAWIIGVGGFLGIGSKYVAVDPSVLKLDRTDGKTLQARIDTTKDQLRAAPEYVYLGKEPPKGAAPASPAGDPASKP
ncbi:photosystem reaction center subunit H [Methylobacterium sp. Leaf361]|uniref:PRC-barrel domain-containing protein n=1 Tax=Methylobacterium TaxID=407 RepID=UPI0006FB501B|nr:PRC-barrel domain-containing protein [Methylobacterium sp. Leaf361]KQS79989.1 photosystem reaction center subunit H [Methylobacterium sp. Leaf361]